MRLFLVLLLGVTLYADIKQNMLNLYQNKRYEEVCNIGFDNFKNYKRDEEFVSLYAFACLKADYIDRLAIPVAVLKFSEESRANSAYLSVILMQKKLLYHAMVDGYELSAFNMPSTNHVLSKVFDLYCKLGKHEKRAFYLFEDENNKKITYKLYLVKGERLDKMVIEEFYDKAMVKRHIYW